MKKIFFILIFIIAFATCCIGCNKNDVTINNMYNIQKVSKETTIDGLTPNPSNFFVVIKLNTKKINIDKLQEDFFSVINEKSSVSDGTNTVLCTYLAFNESGENLNATLIYEVPENFDTSKPITLSGANFSPLALTVK